MSEIGLFNISKEDFFPATDDWVHSGDSSLLEDKTIGLDKSIRQSRLGIVSRDIGDAIKQLESPLGSRQHRIGDTRIEATFDQF